MKANNFYIFLAALFIIAPPSFAQNTQPELQVANKRAQNILIKILDANQNLCADKSQNLKCNVTIFVIPNSKINANTYEQNINVNIGTMRLLDDDNELAFIIAHETAHAMLGHAGKGKEDAINNPKIRAQMEKDADNMGILLMKNAKYNPQGAIEAEEKIARYGRGPINKAFNKIGIEIHGPYLKHRDRIEFLKTRINELDGRK